MAIVGLCAIPATAATPTFDANCTGCHITPPQGGRINAAGAALVVNAANTNHGMGLSAGQLAAIPTIVAEFDAYFFPGGRLEPTATVGYQSSLNSITMTTLVIDTLVDAFPVITSTSISSPASRGSATGNTPNSLVVKYSHSASNCIADQFQVVGTGSATTAPRIVNVNITHPAAPIATTSSSAIAYNTGGTSIPLTLSGGPTASIAIDSQPSAGSVTGGAGTSATYFASSTSYASPVSFTYHAVGPCGEVSSSVTVNLTVSAPPAPTVTTKTQTVQANTTTNINLSANISGIYTGISIATQPANGTAVVVGTNTVDYTPNTNFSGSDPFTFTANGPGGSSAPGNVNITVTAAPLTANKSVTVTYQTATPIDLTSSITGAFTSVAVASPPSHGTAIVTNTSTITYTPAAGYFGPDSFTYTATGAGGTSTPATVNITVNPPAPTTSAKSVTVPGNTPTPIDVSTSISGVSTSVNVVSPAAHGSVTVTGPTTFTYTPTLNYVGPDSFTFTATGPGGTSNVSTVTITVQPPPPPGSTAATATVPYNTQTTINLFTSLSGSFISVAIVTPPTHGTATTSGTLVTYTPTAGYYGPDSLVFIGLGLGGTSPPQTLSITVSPPGAPTVTAATVSVPFNTAVPIDLTGSVAGVFTSIAIATQPTNGTVTINGNIATYKPNNGFTGADSFTFTATGPGGTSAPATVSLTVNTAPPIAAATSMTVVLNGSGTIDLAPFISGSGITGIAIVTPPAHGTAGVNGTKVTYVPAPDFFGTDSFTYTAFGNAGTSPPARITVTVVGRPDPTKSAAVPGIIDAQNAAAQRFAKAQISNFQQRLESLHSHAPAPENPAVAPRAAQATKVPREEPIRVASAGGVPLGDMIPAATTNALASALANSIMSLAGSQSISVAAGSTNADMGNGVEAWLAGSLRFGNLQSSGPSPMRFTTDGMSAGVDKRLNARTTLGVGVGYARDKTDIGTDGSKNRTIGTSFAAYGSFAASRNTFIDVLLGYSSLDIDSDRFVSMMNEFARASRKADQWFGSLSASYEHRYESMLVSPYARLDYASTRFKQATESGGGAGALAYFDQTVPMFQGTLGLRVESQHDARFGSVRPRARIEFTHEFEDDRAAAIAYADDFGTRYSIAPTGTKRNALLLGIGSDFIVGRGLKLGLDYYARRASRDDMDQGIRLQITQALDGKGAMGQWFGSSLTFDDPVRIEAGYVYDDDVTRARDARDKLADSIFSVSASKGKVFPLGANTRAIGSVFVSGEDVRRYTGLGRVSAGAQGELQYRASGDFDAITFALQGRVVGDYYDSPIRRGYRYSLSLSARQSLTDRIDAFAALTGSQRFGKSAVFDLKDYGAKLNLDYALGGSNGSLYAAGEYRRGDTVSSGRFALESIDLAEVFTPDDTFGPGFFAYRFEAKTWLGTLGYNRPLGPRDAIDLSWRRAQSTPVDRPTFNVPGALRYIDNQYSIIYLLRF